MRGGPQRGALADSHGTYCVCRKYPSPLHTGRIPGGHKAHLDFSEFLPTPALHTVSGEHHTGRPRARQPAKKSPFLCEYLHRQCRQGSSGAYIPFPSQTAKEFPARHSGGSYHGFGTL